MFTRRRSTRRKKREDKNVFSLHLPPIRSNTDNITTNTSNTNTSKDFVLLSDLLNGTYLREKAEQQLKKQQRAQQNKQQQLQRKLQKLQQENERIKRMQACLPVDPDHQLAYHKHEEYSYKTFDFSKVSIDLSKVAKKLKTPLKNIAKAVEEYRERERAQVWRPGVIRAPVPWHTSYVLTRNRMKYLHMHTHPVIRQAGDITRVLLAEVTVCGDEDVGRTAELPLTCVELETRIASACGRAREILVNEWRPRVADHVVRHEAEWSRMSRHITDCFFRTLYVVMARHLREFTLRNLEHFHTYFQLYRDGNDFGEEYRDFVLTERPLLCIQVNVNDGVDDDNICSLLEFNPALNEIRNRIVDWCASVVRVNQNIPRLENLLFPDMHHDVLVFLMCVKEEEEYVEMIISDIVHTYDINCVGPVNYLSCYRKYVQVINKESHNHINAMLRDTITHLQDFQQLIKQYDDTYNEIISMRRYVYLNMILLDCGDLNNFLAQTVLDLKWTVINYFMESNRKLNKEICSTYQTISQRSSEMPETTSQLVQLLQYIKYSKDVIMVKLKQQTRLSSECLLFLMDHAIFTDDDITLNTRVFVWPSDIRVIMETSLKTLSGKKYMAEEALKQHKSLFEEKLKRHERLFEGFRRLDPPLINIELLSDNVKRVDDIHDKLTEDRQEAADINEDERLLEQPVSEFSQLISMLTSLDPFYKLWHVCYDFYTGYEKWYYGPFALLNGEEISDIVDEQESLLTVLNKRLSDCAGARRVADMVLARVHKFKQLVPLLKAICNQGLRERHWEKASEYSGQPLCVTSETSLSEMVELGLVQYIPALNEISVSASKELALETMLNTMKQDWKDVKFQTVAYRETGVPVLESVDDIQQMLDDHILKSQTMRGSPYIKPFQVDMQLWEEKLISMQDIIDDWLQVQNTWMYLEAIFNSEDIMRQMPAEARTFKDIDRSWRSIMANTVVQPSVLIATEQPSLPARLTDAIDQLVQIQRSLNDYLEKKRQVFPRFFFLSNDELLELLSETKDPRRVQPHIKKCFEAIISLKFNEEEDIEGMVSEYGECVNFTNSITPSEAKGMVEKWLCLLEEQMKVSLRDNCQSCLGATSQGPMSILSSADFIDTWPTQVQIVVNMITATTQITEAIQNNSMCKLHDAYKDTLHNIMQHLQHPSSNIKTRITLEALVIVNMSNIQVLSMLTNTGVNSYEWISQMRYYWKDNTIICSIMHTDLLYGFEYLGNMRILAQTESTIKTFRFVACALKFNKFCGIEGEQGTGKTETVKHLAALMARKCVTFTCYTGIKCSVLEKFFKGVVQSGSWLCLDGFDNVQVQVLSLISQILYNIQCSLLNKCKVVNIQGQDFNINHNCAMFVIIANKNYKKLPVNLRTLFKVCSMSRPDIAAISRILLCCKGFAEYVALGNKVCRVLELCKECISGCDQVGIRQLRHITTQAADYTSTSLSEAQRVRDAIATIIQPAIETQQDRDTFNKICSSVFHETAVTASDKEESFSGKVVAYLESKHLQAVPHILDKIHQMSRVIEEMRGVVILGSGTCGKSVLHETMASLAHCNVNVVNPYSLGAANMLYGYYDQGQWHDGVVCTIVREMASSSSSSSRKWIVFDARLDLTWTECLHTALDNNNRTICLLSGETIKLCNEYNIIFESDHMTGVSPAFVSRCAVIYMDQSHLSWKTIYESFVIETKSDITEKQMKIISDLVDWIVPHVLKFITEQCDFFIKTGQLHIMQSFNRILKAVLKGVDDNNENAWCQASVLFAIVWGLASTISENSKHKLNAFLNNLRNNEIFPAGFKWETRAFMPESRTVFDYVLYKNNDTYWVEWNSPEMLSMSTASDLLVKTEQYCRVEWFIKTSVVEMRFPCVVAGPGACGKTVTSRQVLGLGLPKDKYVMQEVTVTPRTGARQLQDTVMAKLDRRRKGVFGPPMGKHCVLLVHHAMDTQEPVEVLRQYLQYDHWYQYHDNTKLYLVDMQMVATLTKSNKVSERFLSHLHVIPVDSVTLRDAEYIFTTIIQKHFQQGSYSHDIIKMAKVIVKSSLEFLNFVESEFPKTMESSHYLWNIRDVRSVIEGICRVPSSRLTQVDKLACLWRHEITRVFGDRLINESQHDRLLQHFTSHQTSLKLADTHSQIHFGNYMEPDVYPKVYDRVTSLEEMKEKLLYCIAKDVKMSRNNGVIHDKLVLFDYVLDHVSRASRALSLQSGHIVCIGRDGYGKKTVIHLTSVALQVGISDNYTCNQQYTRSTWQQYLRDVTMSCGVDDQVVIMLLPMEVLGDADAMNDAILLASQGDLPNLYKPEHKTAIIDKMLTVAREMGYVETTPSVLMNIFVERVKKNLKIAITLSPASSNFTALSSMFPVLSSYFVFDWYLEWPKEAYENIASVYLKQFEHLDEKYYKNITTACTYFHKSSQQLAERFLETEGFQIHITSMTYFELFRVFEKSYKEKVKIIEESQKRYLGGLKQLSDAEEQVILMQQQLTKLQPQLLETSTTTEQLMIKIEQDTVLVEAQKEIVAADEALSNEAAATAQAIKDDCEGDLAEAVPALEAAIEALNTLRPPDITLVKAMKNPPAGVKLVLEAVCVMKNIKTERKMNQDGLIVDDYWGPSLKMLGDLKFLDSLKLYDKDNINPAVMKRIRERYIPDREFQPEVITKVSTACEGLCRWVRAMEVYDRVVKVVTPKKAALELAEKELYVQMSMLNEKRAQLQDVLDKLQTLNDEFAEYTRQKKQLEDQIYECETKLDRASTLIEGLGGERSRWNDIVLHLHNQLNNSIGDILLSCFIISHLGGFTYKYRSDLINQWIETVCNHNSHTHIRITDNFDIITIMSDIDQLRLWQMASLSNDAFSIQNAIIIQSSYLYPLITDPQELARNWIMNIEKKNNIVMTRISDKTFKDDAQEAIEHGKPLIIICTRNVQCAIVDKILNSRVFHHDKIRWNHNTSTSIRVHENFHLYLICDTTNISYTSHFSMKVNIVNFSVCQEGLEEYVLSCFVRHHEPELEEKRSTLLVQSANNKVALRNTEDLILSVLSGHANILEDEQANHILITNKQQSRVIITKQRDDARAQRQVEQQRNQYLPFARKVASLYTLVDRLNCLSPLYEYSLRWFLALFEKSISDKSAELDRVFDAFRLHLFRHVSCGLFDKHRIVLLLQLLIFRLKDKGVFDDRLLDVIVNDDTAKFDDDDFRSVEWLPQNSWTKLRYLYNDILGYENFEKEFKEHEDVWRKVYESEYPEKCALPPPYEHDNLVHFVTLRSIRPSRVKQYINILVREELGSEYLIKDYKIMEKSCNNNSDVPILIISEDFDVRDKFEACAGDAKSKVISVGGGNGDDDGDEDDKSDDIQDAIMSHDCDIEWLLVMNIHLLQETQIQRLSHVILARVTTRTRLVLTTKPPHHIPHSLLRYANKIAMEEESGIEKKLQQLLINNSSNSKQDDNNTCNKTSYNKFLFSIFLFHAFLLQRRDFGENAFNYPYNFDNGHLSYAIQQSVMAFEENMALHRYMMLECNYGGIIYDDYDFRKIHLLLRDFFPDNLLQRRFSLFGKEEYAFPGDEVFQAMPENTNDFTFIEMLENHCLNTSSHNHLDDRWNKQITRGLKTYCALPKQKSIKNNLEEQKLITHIMDKLPKFEILQNQNRDFFQRIYNREMFLYKNLTRIIKSSLSDLLNALKGEIAFEEKQSEMLKCVTLYKIPNMWKRHSFPTQKTLAAFLEVISLRWRFFKQWKSNNFPNKVTISAFFQPKNLLYGFLGENATSEEQMLCYELAQDEKSDNCIDMIGLRVDGGSGGVLPTVRVGVAAAGGGDGCSCPWYYVSTRMHYSYHATNYITTIPLPLQHDYTTIMQNIAIIMDTTYC